MLSFPERFFHRLRPRQLKNGGLPPRFPHCRDRAVRRHAANRGLLPPKQKSRHFGTETGTEELAHWELLGAMLHQIMKCATPAAIRAAGLEGNFALHGYGSSPPTPTATISRRTTFPSPATRSRTSLSIWRRSRIPGRPTSTSFSLRTIRISPPPSASCGSARSCISSVSANAWAYSST